MFLIPSLACGGDATEKTIICQSRDGLANVRIKEHYGSYTEHRGLILVCYDATNIYLGRKFQPVAVFPISRWSIDSAWVETVHTLVK